MVCALATATAQREALTLFQERLHGRDREAVRGHFAKIMSKTQEGRGPPYAEIDRLLTE